jgi:ribonuclease HII
MLLPFVEEHRIEAGCDEAGRGCIFGPVVAAAVILPKDFSNKDLNDSKKLSEKKRDVLRIEIEKEAISWAVFAVDHAEIDRINILNASILAMQQAALKLAVQPDFLLIDGNRFKPFSIPYECYVKGDGTYSSIAAASVLAKTHRDEIMMNFSLQYPEYKLDKNKGYPTKDHCEAIQVYGYTEFHRKTFHVKSLSQLKFSF